MHACMHAAVGEKGFQAEEKEVETLQEWMTDWLTDWRDEMGDYN